MTAGFRKDLIGFRNPAVPRKAYNAIGKGRMTVEALCVPVKKAEQNRAAPSRKKLLPY